MSSKLCFSAKFPGENGLKTVEIMLASVMLKVTCIPSMSCNPHDPPIPFQIEEDKIRTQSHYCSNIVRDVQPGNVDNTVIIIL